MNNEEDDMGEEDEAMEGEDDSQDSSDLEIEGETD